MRDLLPDVNGIPPEIRAAIQRTIESPVGEKINDLVWDGDTATLDVHVVGDDGTSLNPALRDAFGDGYRIVQDQYSSKELASLAYNLAQLGSAAGMPIASVTANQTNSGLIVTLVEDGSSARRPSADQKQLRSISAVSLQFAVTPSAPQQTNGWRWGDQSPFWGGSRVYGPGAGHA
jgi:hypothetical protein